MDYLEQYNIWLKAGLPAAVNEELKSIENNADEEFINFINNYNSENRPEVIELLKKYSSKNIIIFHSREEAEAYMLEGIGE